MSATFKNNKINAGHNVLFKCEFVGCNKMIETHEEIMYEGRLIDVCKRHKLMLRMKKKYGKPAIVITKPEL